MKKTDILYLLLLMLIVYFISVIFGNNHDSKPLELHDPLIDNNTQYSQEWFNENEQNEDNLYYDTVEVSSDPIINARSAVVMDFETGTILYEKNAYRKRPMASTTKIMSAIIALENSDLDDDVIISGKAAGMGGSVMGLKKDSTVKMYDLLNGMLICSGNDAAVAIAEHVGGNVENFCEMMNKKAVEIGAFSTSFSNPHGLDAENHYTTAYDLAKITRYALKNPVFNEIVKKKEYYFNGRVLNSTNEMLTGYEGADGVKTGYTGLAGRCLVTSATRNDMRFISVVLFCDTKNLRTTSSQKILDYAFTEYGKVFLLKKGRIAGSVKVDRSKSLQEVMVAVSEDLIAVLKHSQRDNLYTRVSLPEKVMAPVRQGSILGTISIFQGEKIIAETSLITIESAHKMDFMDYFQDVIKKWLVMIH
ncbi:MAG TPA: D-alanyl-D-alanine carboxypeptidase [Clostridiaceae bacterium]|nr:D-alanyl-D-alanine carboxypeptidase [Clostridiaceae bacterium]